MLSDTFKKHLEPLLFPVKLYELAHSKECKSIQWSEDGKSVKLDTALVPKECFHPSVFNVADCKHVFRQLSYYRFHRIGKAQTVWEFQHPVFQADRLDLVKTIRRASKRENAKNALKVTNDVLAFVEVRKSSRLENRKSSYKYTEEDNKSESENEEFYEICNKKNSKRQNSVRKTKKRKDYQSSKPHKSNSRNNKIKGSESERNEIALNFCQENTTRRGRKRKTVKAECEDPGYKYSSHFTTSSNSNRRNVKTNKVYAAEEGSTVCSSINKTGKDFSFMKRASKIKLKPRSGVTKTRDRESADKATQRSRNLLDNSNNCPLNIENSSHHAAANSSRAMQHVTDGMKNTTYESLPNDFQPFPTELDDQKGCLTTCSGASWIPLSKSTADYDSSLLYTNSRSEYRTTNSRKDYDYSYSVKQEAAGNPYQCTVDTNSTDYSVIPIVNPNGFPAAYSKPNHGSFVLGRTYNWDQVPETPNSELVYENVKCIKRPLHDENRYNYHVNINDVSRNNRKDVSLEGTDRSKEMHKRFANFESIPTLTNTFLSDSEVDREFIVPKETSYINIINSLPALEDRTFIRIKQEPPDNEDPWFSSSISLTDEEVLKNYSSLFASKNNPNVSMKHRPNILLKGVSEDHRYALKSNPMSKNDVHRLHPDSHPLISTTNVFRDGVEPNMLVKPNVAPILISDMHTVSPVIQLNQQYPNSPKVHSNSECSSGYGSVIIKGKTVHCKQQSVEPIDAVSIKSFDSCKNIHFSSYLPSVKPEPYHIHVNDVPELRSVRHPSTNVFLDKAEPNMLVNPNVANIFNSDMRQVSPVIQMNQQYHNSPKVYCDSDFSTGFGSVIQMNQQYKNSPKVYLDAELSAGYGSVTVEDETMQYKQQSVKPIDVESIKYFGSCKNIHYSSYLTSIKPEPYHIDVNDVPELQSDSLPSMSTTNVFLDEAESNMLINSNVAPIFNSDMRTVSPVIQMNQQYQNSPKVYSESEFSAGYGSVLQMNQQYKNSPKVYSDSEFSTGYGSVIQMNQQYHNSPKVYSDSEFSTGYGSVLQMNQQYKNSPKVYSDSEFSTGYGSVKVKGKSVRCKHQSVKPIDVASIKSFGSCKNMHKSNPLHLNEPETYLADFLDSVQTSKHEKNYGASKSIESPDTSLAHDVKAEPTSGNSLFSSPVIDCDEPTTSCHANVPNQSISCQNVSLVVVESDSDGSSSSSESSDEPYYTSVSPCKSVEQYQSKLSPQSRKKLIHELYLKVKNGEMYTSDLLESLDDEIRNSAYDVLTLDVELGRAFV